MATGRANATSWLFSANSNRGSTERYDFRYRFNTQQKEAHPEIRVYSTVCWELTVHCIIVWCGGVLERLLVAFPDPFSDPELCGWIRIKWIRCDLVLPGLTDNNVLDFDQS